MFSVEKGVIKLNRGTGWLRSVDTFGDFVLTMEFRFLEDGANSGIFVRTSKTSNRETGLWPTSRYQVQCMNNLEGANPLGYIFPHNVPEVEFEYDLKAVKQAYRPTGEWLTYTITVKGETLRTELNGIKISSARVSPCHRATSESRVRTGCWNFARSRSRRSRTKPGTGRRAPARLDGTVALLPRGIPRPRGDR